MWVRSPGEHLPSREAVPIRGVGGLLWSCISQLLFLISSPSVSCIGWRAWELCPLARLGQWPLDWEFAYIRLITEHCSSSCWALGWVFLLLCSSLGSPRR